MQRFYQWLYRVAPLPSEDAMLNKGLAYSLVWGKNFLQPIQARMRRRFPFLSAAQLDHYDAVCRAARDHGQHRVYAMAESSHGVVDRDRWEAEFLDRYPWVSRANLRHVFGQAKYYAWKDGLSDTL